MSPTRCDTAMGHGMTGLPVAPFTGAPAVRKTTAGKVSINKLRSSKLITLLCETWQPATSKACPPKKKHGFETQVDLHYL